jgi:hypothetical protein
MDGAEFHLYILHRSGLLALRIFSGRCRSGLVARPDLSVRLCHRSGLSVKVGSALTIIAETVTFNRFGIDRNRG